MASPPVEPVVALVADSLQPIPEPHERALAGASHVSSIWFPVLGPLAFFVLGRNRSSFVAAHSAQALLEFFLLKAVLAVAMAASLIYTVIGVVHAFGPGGSGLDWSFLGWALLKGVAIWLVLGLVGLAVNFASVIQALRAVRGKWPGNGPSGMIAKRIAGR